MKKVLVTGGAGFIGSYLCEYLVKEGFFVVCMDNLLTGKYSNVEQLEGFENFEFINHNVCEYIDIPGQLDYIFHFASPASPIDYLKYPIQTLKVGALGTHNALGLAKAKGSSFLLASTSEVYGDPLEHPQKETYWGNVNPIGPRGVYDEAKRFAEAIAMAYHNAHGVKTRIARIFNTYGPKMRRDDGRAVPTFINQALAGEDITVFGDGLQTRSFCYITDLVAGLCKLMFSDMSDPVNLGNPDEYTIKELATMIIKLSASSSIVKNDPLPVDDPKVRRPDISRAKKCLGWVPLVSVSDGLKTTIEYFKNSDA